MISNQHLYVLLLQERHHNMMEYEFLPSDYKLSFVFDKMRQALRTMPVVEYSISQNTLDNVGNIDLSLI